MLKRSLSFLTCIFVMHLLGIFSMKGAEEFFDWDVKSNCISANFKDWPIEKVLSDIAKATKWDVKLPEDSGVMISGTFKNLPPKRALKRMFGHLNYALFASRKGGKPRLRVFLLPKNLAKETPKPSPSTRRGNPFSRASGGKRQYPAVMERYDKNKDGVIDKAEQEAAKSDLIRSRR